MRIGIIGGGIGGMAAAIGLARAGVEAVVLEQAPGLGRVGADINLTPNAVRALDGLGVGDRIRETAARPTYRISRTWDTGEETSRLPMSAAAEERYGAPQLTMHRADLLAALADALTDALPAGSLRLGRRLERVEERADGVTAHFADGTAEDFDLLVGGDGIHSVVRTAMLGEESPDFTGVVAYRAVVPLTAVSGGVSNLDAFTKWWGPAPEIQIVTFPLNQVKDVFIFATTPQESWREESWTRPGDVVELRAAYSGFHPEARALLDACTEVLKSALYVRDPLPRWNTERMTLLGDAAHPMMPFMAQGAGQAIEDAVVLSRALTSLPDLSLAERLGRYEDARRERTARIQVGSRENSWLKDAGNGDWVYGYDAWSAPLG